jgi:Domain of unknown function (DUF4145)
MSTIFDPGPEPWRTIKCAHCAVSFRSVVEFARLEQDHEAHWFVEKQLCPQCRNFNLFLVSSATFNRSASRPYSDENVASRRLIRPRSTNRDPTPPEVPAQYAQDYLEACLVLADSPKASAALSRRCLQNLLVHEEKPQAKDLAPQIDEVLGKNKFPSHIATSIDAIRNLGNFAAHPLKSQSTGLIVDVEPGEAEWNLDVLEALFDFYFVQPARTKQRIDALNAKLGDLGKPLIKQPPSTP